MNLKKTIIKALSGSNSMEEKVALDDWKSEAKDNINGLRDLAKLDQITPMLQNYQDVDAHKAWKHISQQTGVKTVENRFKLAKLAAVFAIATLGIFLFSYLKPLQSKDILTYHGDKTSNVSLEDGSQINLSKQSTLTQTAFRKTRLEGEAYFSIAKNKNYPFTVQLHHGQIPVFGTEFSIFTSPTYLIYCRH